MAHTDWSTAEQVGELFHYTDAWGFDGILRTGTIRATHCAYLNDSEEIRCGETVARKVLEGLLKDTSGGPRRDVFKRALEQYLRWPLTGSADVFIASFSEDGNSLSQWRAYAADGSGYSVGWLPLKPLNAEDY